MSIAALQANSQDTGNGMVRTAIGPDGKPMLGRARIPLWRCVTPTEGPNKGLRVWQQTTPLPYKDEMSYYHMKGFRLEPPDNLVKAENGELIEPPPALSPEPVKTIKRRKQTKRGNI